MKAFVITIVISMLIIFGGYLAIQQYFSMLGGRRGLQLATKPVLGVCPRGWRNVQGKMCVEPGASITVDDNGVVSGAVRQCTPGSKVGSAGTTNFYCEYAPK